MKIQPPILVLTGAGVSADSGVSTFRDAGGLWEGTRIEDVATPEGFARDPVKVWRWYDERRVQVASCEPNAAHRAIVEMEKTFGDDFTLITQNVDGLHERAGSRAIHRLHGSLWSMRCTGDGRRFEQREVPLPSIPPVCSECGEMLRPDVVWFGELLDAAILDAAATAAERARTVLVIGTSGVVYPAAMLQLIALEHGARVVEFNPERTALSEIATEYVAGRAAVTVPSWWNAHRPST